jgi:YidC/Oxa1 family membrane protein insertase
LGAWDIFLDAIFSVIAWFYSWCGDWGLAIVLITILFRILISPITHKQFKSSNSMQKLQPKIAELKEKYPDDPQRVQQETMKIYQEAKFNPLSGCLPMLLQMPIFIALYNVLQNLPAYIAKTDWLQGRVVDANVISFYGLVPDLAASPSGVFAASGIMAVIPYALMVVLFAASLLIPMLLQNQTDKNTRIMMIVMSVVMLWFGWSAPAGVLLYWDISSYIGVGQQLLTRKWFEHKDKQAELEVIDIAPIKVSVDRKERKARPRKK